jgi:hypothetical protein
MAYAASPDLECAGCSVAATALLIVPMSPLVGVRSLSKAPSPRRSAGALQNDLCLSGHVV